MSLMLPWWGWIVVAASSLFVMLVAFACGHASGWDAGIDCMKREAIRAGLAKACDFDGGWRWWTRDEIINKKHS